MKKLVYKVEDFLIVLFFWFVKKIKLFVKKNKNKKLVVKIFYYLLAIGMIFVSFFIIWFSTLQTPSLDVFDDKLLGQSAKIYDRTGTIILYDLSQKIRRSVVPLDKISPYIVKATISIEDQDFYTHHGIKIQSIIRATLQNIIDGQYSQGGSTLTQQVVKNSLLTTDKKIARKIKEIFLSLKLERSVSKDEIMSLYLNNSPYGGNIYGVEEASQIFFGKHAIDLSIAESAVIASLPKAPSTYNPYTGKKQLLLDRKNLVLQKMYENKYITEDEMKKAQAEVLVFQPKNLGSIKAAHFVMYLKEQLEEKYGLKKMSEGGFKIISTIDYDIQKKGEELIFDYIKKNGKRFNAENGSMVVTDPKSGQILAMIGSRDYFDDQIDGNFNTATAKRQPGSSFKPFVYATGFNKGFLPQTVLFDTPTEFSSSCSPDGIPLVVGATCYNPQNYEGGFKGPMTIRHALGASRNIPAVKMAYLAGVQSIINTATVMGVADLKSPDEYGLSIALGAADVSLLDMTGAYGVFGNDGVKNDITGILKIEDSKGNVVEEFSTSSKRVIPEQTARMINDVLSDVVARNSIFVKAYFKNDVVALKTGTTNNSRDAWMLGYTPDFSVGAWMGNNNNKPMNQISSALIVGPLWKSFADFLITKYPHKESFTKPDDVSSDLKPFMRGVYQTTDGSTHSELFWINKENPTGPAPTNPSSDPLYKNWESSIYKDGFSESTSTTIIVNTNPTQQNISVNIQGSKYNLSKTSSINTFITGYDERTTGIDYFLNGTRVGNSSVSPFGFVVDLNEMKNINPENELKIIEYRNDDFPPRTSSVYFTVSE